MENLTSGHAAEAVLSVLPLNTFSDDFAGRTNIVGSNMTIPAVLEEVQASIDRAEGRCQTMVGLKWSAFYDLARRSYAVIQTGEKRFCGCSDHARRLIGFRRGRHSLRRVVHTVETPDRAGRIPPSARHTPLDEPP